MHRSFLRFLHVVLTLAAGGTACASSASSDADTHDAFVVTDGGPPDPDAGRDGGPPDPDAGRDGGPPDPDLDGAPRPARGIALGRQGEIASFDLLAPFTVRAHAELGAEIGSAHCGSGLCVVTHPSVDRVSVVDPLTLTGLGTITLARGSAPVDAIVIDERTALVTQHGSAALEVVDRVTRSLDPIDLSPLSDADGLPEARMVSRCGRVAYVQLARLDHETGAPSEVPAVLAVIDLDRAGDARLVDVDPAMAGTQGVVLAARPRFDMTIDCLARVLYVAEPAPLFQGGGGYEQVDLDSLTASELPIATGPEVGGFQMITRDLHWIITHTDIGPGPSSHLQLQGVGLFETHNTFALEHVNDLAYDAETDLLVYPDPCATVPNQTGCENGVHLFGAHTGEHLAARPIDVGFPPFEVAIAR